MKNWCKIIPMEDRDILVTKDFNESNGTYEIRVLVKFEWGTATQTMSYKSLEERDNEFDKDNRAFTGLATGLIHLIEE